MGSKKIDNRKLQSIPSVDEIIDFYKIMGLIGTLELASTQIVFTIMHSSFMPAVGVGQSCATLVGKYLGEGYGYEKAKKEFMPNDTVEGADLVLELGPKILKDFKKKKIPLMISLINAICKNKKLEINW